MMSLCSEEKALEIVRDPSVLPYLRFYPESIADVEKYLIGKESLLVVIPVKDEAEVHIASKYRDRAVIRKSLIDGIAWLRGRGFSRITTTAPEERTALINLLKSLGFNYEGERWVL